MTSTWTELLFYANVAAQGLLLVGAAWCIAFPARRIYPMDHKGAVFYVMWLIFYFAFLSNFALVLLDWNSGPWTSTSRFFIGGPMALFGAAFVSWGIATLGSEKTSGLAVDDVLTTGGPYRYSRNPQYVGDMLLFAGVAVIANSELVLVTHALTSLVFLLAPLAEEPWLEAQFGKPYTAYRRDVPRFL
tara:strand:- start:90811 stop:91374 length:564 start_codon:yes stop_codon:yes gene_type:complete